MKLLTLDAQGIGEYVDQLDEEVLTIRKQAMRLTWIMRGGIQYNETLNLSQAERNIISDLSKDNMETTQKSGLPYF